MEELAAAPGELKNRLLEAVAGFSVLQMTAEADSLAREYVARGVFPERYLDDAMHVALASVNGIGYLLSWNFRHLVKVRTRRLVALINTMKDYQPVEIIAPPEL